VRKDYYPLKNNGGNISLSSIRLPYRMTGNPRGRAFFQTGQPRDPAQVCEQQ
jgi:hypothetical protein